MWGCPLHPALIAGGSHFSKKILDNLRYSILDRFLWIFTSILEDFFGPKIDVFEKFLLPDFELQLEVRSANIVILARENAVFLQNWHSCFEVATNEKHKKKQEKHRFEIKLFFHIDFSWILEPTWMDFGLQVGAQKTDSHCLFSKLRPRGVQEAPKRLQERPKGVSRASNSLPKGPQECLKATKTWPGHAQGASRGSLF